MLLSIYSTGLDYNNRVLLAKSLDTDAATAGNDVLLLQRVAKRDESAVGELYDRHSTFLFTFILRILKEQEEAEDALQEVFLRIWDKAESYNPSLGNPMVWITRIARNLAIDRLRSKLGQTRKAEDDLATHGELHADEHHSSPELAASRSQQQRDVARALAAIPPEQRTLIEYAYFQGFTQSELAKHFNLPLGTVKTRIRAGMAALREHLRHLR